MEMYRKYNIMMNICEWLEDRQADFLEFGQNFVKVVGLHWGDMDSWSQDF